MDLLAQARIKGVQSEFVDALGKLRVTENDNSSDNVTSGKKAFEHIMIRAEEPGGNINVVESEDDSYTSTASNGASSPTPPLPPLPCKMTRWTGMNRCSRISSPF